MSVFGNSEYLDEAVTSILRQSFHEFEFLIINDGADKAVREVLKSHNDQRLIVIDQEWLGLTKSLNHAIQLSRGEYLARMDADDVSMSSRLQKQVEILTRDARLGLVGTSYVDIAENGKKLSETLLPVDSYVLKDELLYQNQFCHGSVMFRRECLNKAGAYRDEFLRAQDYDLWLRIAEHFEVTNLPEILYKRRVAPGSISIAKKREQALFAKYARKCAQARRNGKTEPLGQLRRLRKTSARRSCVSRFDDRFSRFHYQFHHGRSFFVRRELAQARPLFLSAMMQLPYRLDAFLFFCATYLPFCLINKLSPVWKMIHKRMTTNF